MKNKNIIMGIIKRLYFYLSKNKNIKKIKVKSQIGLTLVEVVVALLLISIITLVLVRGTMVAVDTVKVNRAKTKAISIANEKIEFIRTINYDDISDTYLNDNPLLDENEYEITYEIDEVYEEGNAYKQLEVTVFKEPMKVPINVITQIYSLTTEQSGGDTTPPVAPTGLTATATGSTSIDLDWNNNTETDLAGYKIYRSTTGGFTPGSENFITQVTTSSYSDTELTPNTTYYYRVTAVDTSGNQSQPSVQAIATTSQESATTQQEYTVINIPFTYDGAGEYYWKTSNTNWSYVNSWDLDLLEINGVDYTNQYENKSKIPPSSDGYWYIHYIGSYDWSHVEFK